jgi:hypothetical protein
MGATDMATDITKCGENFGEWSFWDERIALSSDLLALFDHERRKAETESCRRGEGLESNSRKDEILRRN